jgi:hypothetical protein
VGERKRKKQVLALVYLLGYSNVIAMRKIFLIRGLNKKADRSYVRLSQSDLDLTPTAYSNNGKTILEVYYVFYFGGNF